MRVIRTLALVASLQLPFIVAAQPVSTTPPAGVEAALAPSHLEAARQLISLIGIQQSAMEGVVVAVDQQIVANPEIAEYREIMIDWARDVFASPEAETAFALLYANALDETDLRALIAFYESPVGRRVAEATIRLIGEGAALGERLAERAQPDLMRRLEAYQNQ